MKKLNLSFVFICFLIVSVKAQDIRNELNLIAPSPSLINLNIGNSTEYQSVSSITLKAGFEVSQSGNTNALKYFKAYIVEFKPVDVSYALMNKDLDASYTTTINNVIYFIYDEKYNTGTLNYKIYNYARVPLAVPVLTKTVVGRNYFQINMNAIIGAPSGIEEQKYFTIEVVNDKKEVFLLRFKYL